MFRSRFANISCQEPQPREVNDSSFPLHVDLEVGATDRYQSLAVDVLVAKDGQDVVDYGGPWSYQFFTLAHACFVCLASQHRPYRPCPFQTNEDMIKTQRPREREAKC